MQTSRLKAMQAQYAVLTSQEQQKQNIPSLIAKILQLAHLEQRLAQNRLHSNALLSMIIMQTAEIGGNPMKITINENKELLETEIIISCQKADEQILRIVAGLRAIDKKINGLLNGQTFLLNIQDILYIDTVDRKTFLYTANQIYETPLKLYELEERLAAEDFFRATKSSVISFAKIISLRPEFGGRMLVTMENGEQLAVSRQYVPVIKKKLGIEDKIL